MRTKEDGTVAKRNLEEFADHLGSEMDGVRDSVAPVAPVIESVQADKNGTRLTINADEAMRLAKQAAGPAPKETGVNAAITQASREGGFWGGLKQFALSMGKAGGFEVDYRRGLGNLLGAGRAAATGAAMYEKEHAALQQRINDYNATVASLAEKFKSGQISEQMAQLRLQQETFALEKERKQFDDMYGYRPLSGFVSMYPPEQRSMIEKVMAEAGFVTNLAPEGKTPVWVTTKADQLLFADMWKQINDPRIKNSEIEQKREELGSMLISEASDIMAKIHELKGKGGREDEIRRLQAEYDGLITQHGKLFAPSAGLNMESTKFNAMAELEKARITAASKADTQAQKQEVPITKWREQVTKAAQILTKANDVSGNDLLLLAASLGRNDIAQNLNSSNQALRDEAKKKLKVAAETQKKAAESKIIQSAERALERAGIRPGMNSDDINNAVMPLLIDNGGDYELVELQQAWRRINDRARSGDGK